MTTATIVLFQKWYFVTKIVLTTVRKDCSKGHLISKTGTNTSQPEVSQ